MVGWGTILVQLHLSLSHLTDLLIPPTHLSPQLFLGTEKYPRENTYKDLVNKNGGSSNASTSMDLTLYKFEASSEAYPSVLDVFSQFFICTSPPSTHPSCYPFPFHPPTYLPTNSPALHRVGHGTRDEGCGRGELQEPDERRPPPPPNHESRRRYVLPSTPHSTHSSSQQPTHLLTYFLNADPNHNWSKFSTGNLATLRDHLPPGFNIRTALLDLYKE